jgi:CRISPR-associated protein Cmr1
MENRKTLTVTLETVTPLFLGGAEARDRDKPPELRPPALRGALRYWLRAALGGVIGDNNLDDLHRLESAVFGSTEYGSPIQVRLRGPRPLQSSNEKILPHKEGQSAGQRKAFSAGQKIELLVSQFRSNDEAIWRTACSTLNLALTFGGVGLRSRRGYGTLRVVQATDPALVPVTPTSLEGWEQHIRQVTENVTASVRDLAHARKVTFAGLPTDPARYPCATRSGLIRLCDVQAPSAMEATRQFMQKIRKDRAFGDIQPRQASPLWVRPIQLGERYGLLLATLASRFNGANYPAVQNFLNEKFTGKDIGVKGWNA